MICRYCNSTNLKPRGSKRHRYICGDCGKWSTIHPQPIRKSIPKILLLDIETLPIVRYAWSLHEEGYASPKMIIKDWCVLTWAAKWLFDTKIMGYRLSSQEALDRDDKSLVEKMWKLLDEADIVVAHNGNRFDLKKLNTRFIVHGLNRPMYYQTIDTLSVARQSFAFTSNSLDFINKTLGIHQKFDTDMSLWERCDNGDKEALEDMLMYNKNDVEILEETYIKFLPWIPNHPSIKVYADSSSIDCCDNCGSQDLKKHIGFKYTQTAKYSAYRCNQCGAIGRSRKRI